MTPTLRAVIAGLLLAGATAAPAFAQSPKANGETLAIHNYAGTTGNLHAVIANAKGFCTKYNFTCDVKIINSASLAMQALVGKSIDVAQVGVQITSSTQIAGGDVVIVGVSLPIDATILTVRADVPLPNKAKGYPAVMADFKGLKIGVPARGTSLENTMNAMLRDAGVQPSEVTYVGIGGPSTAYSSMVVGKLVDAVIMFEPMKTLCKASKACDVVVDMMENEGPSSVKAGSKAGTTFAMRRETVTSNPKLVAAFQAAMVDAVAWANDPANLDEVIKIYTPQISFGDLPGADQLRRAWIKDSIRHYSKDLKVDRAAVKAIIDFHVAAKTLDKQVEVDKLVWDMAP